MTKREMTDPETSESLSEKMSSHRRRRRRAAKGKKKLSFEDDPGFLNGEPFLIDLSTSNYDTSVCHNLARLSVSHIDKTDQYYRSDHVLAKLFIAEAWKDVGDRILFILSYSARELGAGKKKLLIFDTYVLYDCGVEERTEVAAYYDRSRHMTPQEKYIYSRRFVRSGGFDVPDMPCIKWTGEIVPIHLHLSRSLKKLCVEFAELAVATFNKKKPESSEGELELVELVKAMWKQDFENVYYLTFEARYMHGKKVQKIYQAIVRTRNRSEEPEVLCFRLKDSRSWLWKLDGFDAPDSYNYPIREDDDDDDTSSWDTSTWDTCELVALTLSSDSE